MNEETKDTILDAARKLQQTARDLKSLVRIANNPDITEILKDMGVTFEVNDSRFVTFPSKIL